MVARGSGSPRYVHRGAPAPDDDDEGAPLIDRAPPSRVGNPGGSGHAWVTALYFGVMVINGALIGALGPSFDSLQRTTALDDAALGKIVMQNRLCKLAGTLVWCLYARRLQRPRGRERPHLLFAGLLLLTAATAAAIGIARHPSVLQAALLTWGLCYGITDSGVTSLTVWRWGHNSRRRRIDVALLNAGFTVGALIGPAVVAASLRFGGGRWAFFCVAGFSVTVGCALWLQPSLALPVAARDAEPPKEPQKLLGYNRMGSYNTSEGGLRQRRSFEACFISSMALVLCCCTGCEHGMATWLSPYGVEEGGLSPQKMAVMSSSYWGVMCAGRLGWTLLSGVVSSTWPMVFFDVGASLVSSALLLLTWPLRSAFEPLLWLSAFGLGLGVSSGLPCIYSVVPESQVEMTPWAITLLNAASTLGETAFPYLIGLAFSRGQRAMLGQLMLASQVLALAVAYAARRQAARFAEKEARRAATTWSGAYGE